MGSWFSCMVRVVSVIDGTGLSSEQKSVFVFQAGSWTEAKGRALVIGRSLERTYENTQGQRVRIFFRELATLDELGELRPEGSEVYNETIASELLQPFIPPEGGFHPESSEPKQTGV